MKKLILSISILLVTNLFTKAQVIPSFQFGIKGGINLSKFSTNNSFDSDNRAGYLAGVWARIGALGFNVQPEVYYASKTATFNISGGSNTITYKSIDVPLLIGYKIGTFGIGGRLYTGPMASFIISDQQNISGALSNIVHVNFKNQTYAWQFGAGVDISSLSVDLRYEKGLNDVNSNGYAQKMDLFNLTLGYKLF
jgi:hypothetical protein